MVQDCARLLAAAEPRNVEVHADDAEPRIADAHRRRDRAARFQRRQVKRMAFLDFRPLAHEQRIAVPADRIGASAEQIRSEEHTSELQSLMRISYAVFCLKKKKQKKN